MDYGEVKEWVRTQDVIENRVSIINQVLGARYDGCLDNPLVVRYRRGTYELSVCGAEYASWQVYDMESTSAALDCVQALKRGLWLLKRSGRLTFT